MLRKKIKSIDSFNINACFVSLLIIRNFILLDPFFGPNHEITIGDNQTTRGSLCNYGSQEETLKDHVITCLTGPMLGRVVTIKNLFVGGLRLCDVRVMGLLI